MTALSYKEVMALADLQMIPAEDELHSELLYKRQAGFLTPDENLKR